MHPSTMGLIVNTLVVVFEIILELGLTVIRLNLRGSFRAYLEQKTESNNLVHKILRTGNVG